MLSVVSRILNEFEVGFVSDELNKELENDGRPHDGQIHTPDGFIFISLYMWIEAAAFVVNSHPTLVAADGRITLFYCG